MSEDMGKDAFYRLHLMNTCVNLTGSVCLRIKVYSIHGRIGISHTLHILISDSGYNNCELANGLLSLHILISDSGYNNCKIANGLLFSDSGKWDSPTTDSREPDCCCLGTLSDTIK